MVEIYICAIALAILAVGFLAGTWFGHRRAARLNPSTQGLIAQLRAEVAAAERRASEYQKVFPVMQTERDGWMKRFYEMCSGHDAAQNMMTRELISLVNQFRADTGKMPKFNLRVAELREQFGEKYDEVIQLYRTPGALEAKMARKGHDEQLLVQGIEGTPKKALVE